MSSHSARKIAIDSRKGCTKEFILKDEEGKELSKIQLATTSDNYNNPILHITAVDEERGQEIFENPYTLEYDLVQFCEDVAVGYLEGSFEKPKGVYEICKSLRRIADVLEYKYRED